MASTRRRTIAVTGTRGLIGSRFVARLEEDESCRRIVLLDLVPPKTRSPKSVFYRVDLTEPSATERIADAIRHERPSALVHLASLQHPKRDPAYAHELESVGTGRLLTAVAAEERPAGGLPIVVGGTTLVYGAHADNPNFLAEEAPLRPRADDAFLRGKVEVENALRDHARTHRGPLTVLRFAPILEASHRSLASRYLRLPTVPTLLGYNPLMQLLSADDAVEGILRAIAVRPTGYRVYNVAAPGTLPLLAAIRLAGRTSVPAPHFVLAPILDALFQAGAAIAPATMLDALRWLCVAAVERAADELDFLAGRSTKDVILAFAAGSVSRAA